VWTEELPCFRSVANELAEYYAALPLEAEAEAAESAEDAGATAVGTRKAPAAGRDYPGPAGSEAFLSVLLPGLKAHLAPPRQCAADGTTVVQLATLEQLYKIFERC
jgi:DNA mismatch repair protein MLH1